MFNEVRILDAEGKVKKVVSRKILSRRYWKSFFDSPVSGAPAKNTKGRGRKSKKTNSPNVDLDESFFSEN